MASGFSDGQPGDTTVIFPIFEIATILFESYERNVDHLCHVLHLPTIRRLIRTVYSRIHERDEVLPGQAALLLSIFALAAYFFQPSHDSKVATTKADAIRISKFLSSAALDVLDHSRRNTSGTLEDVQAYIHMSYVAYHLDGFSAKGRLLCTSAAAIARELRMHRLDDEESSTADRETSVHSLVDRETRRRVFWHIVATDW